MTLPARQQQIKLCVCCLERLLIRTLSTPMNFSCLCCHTGTLGEQMPGDKARQLPWEHDDVSEQMSTHCLDLEEFLKTPEVHFWTQFYTEIPVRCLCKPTKQGWSWACLFHFTLLGAKEQLYSQQWPSSTEQRGLQRRD